jgi:hypothetical protein
LAAIVTAPVIFRGDRNHGVNFRVGIIGTDRDRLLKCSTTALPERSVPRLIVITKRSEADPASGPLVAIARNSRALSILCRELTASPCRISPSTAGAVAKISALDTRTYKKGIKVSKAEMKGLDIVGDAFHPEWNYTIRPRQQSP